MDNLRVVCPHCQLTKDIRRDHAPKQAVTATCPRCKGKFTLDPAACGTVPQPQSTPPPIEATTPAQPQRRTEQLRISPRPATAPPPRSSELRGIGELLGDAWTVFQNRFATLFIIYLLFLLAAAAAPAIMGGLGFALGSVFPSAKGVVITLCILIGLGGGIIGFSWGWGALVAASLDETLDARAAFALGREKLLPFALVSFLVGFMITGGYLLFVIPGVIFSVWFFFANFVIFDDDTRGMSALFKSRAYTVGRWFDVFLRLMVIWACMAVAGAIPVVGLLITLVAVPFAMVYQALLFKDLKETAGPVIYSCGFSDSARWVALASLGYIVVPGVLIASFGLTLYRNLSPFMGADKPGISLRLPGSSASSDGGFRVIEIPAQGTPSATPSVGSTDSGQSSSPQSSLQPGQGDRSRKPKNIHVFIYSVNYAGKVEANGVTLKELETKSDMQYNYNENGEQLQLGHNTITVDYSPVRDAGAAMKPRLHLKISYWNGSDRRILGDWEIQDSEPGKKTFDLAIPEECGER